MHTNKIESRKRGETGWGVKRGKRQHVTGKGYRGRSQGKVGIGKRNATWAMRRVKGEGKQARGD